MNVVAARMMRPRAAGVGDFAHQLGAYGATELLEIVGHDQERSRAADDVLLVVLVECEIGRSAEIGAIHHDGQAVHHDPLRHQPVADDLGRRTVIGAAVT